MSRKKPRKKPQVEVQPEVQPEAQPEAQDQVEDFRRSSPKELQEATNNLLVANDVDYNDHWRNNGDGDLTITKTTKAEFQEKFGRNWREPFTRYQIDRYSVELSNLRKERRKMTEEEKTKRLLEKRLKEIEDLEKKLLALDQESD